MTPCPHCSVIISDEWNKPYCPFCGEKVVLESSMNGSSETNAPALTLEETRLDRKNKKKKKDRKVVLVPASNAVVAPLDRISNVKMALLTLFTLGLFPVDWFAARFPRFNRLARKEEQIEGWLAVLDLLLFLIWWGALVIGIINVILILSDIAIETQMFRNGIEWKGLFLLLRIAASKSSEFFLTWPFFAIPIMFLLHRYLILWARWNLRSFVARRNREMAKNVAPSWFFLWIFGGLYLQHHINLLHDAQFFLTRGQS